MKRLFAVLGLTTSIAIGTPIALATTSGATEVTTRGSCMKLIDPELKDDQASGQTGNGSLTIVENPVIRLVIIPAAFDGGFGCPIN